MANILLVDSDEIAQKAMKGLLARGDHRFAAVDNVEDAWDFIYRNVRIDLLIVELKLKGDGGLVLVERLKSDRFLNELPIIVYTAHGNRDNVVKILNLKVQNFLIKPYRDESLYAEIAKAVDNPWISKHFEDEKAIFRSNKIEPKRLRKLLDSLHSALEKLQPFIEDLREKGDDLALIERLTRISAHAMVTGATTIGNYLTEACELAKAADWAEFDKRVEGLEFLTRLIFYRLNPSNCPHDFFNNAELNSEAEAEAKEPRIAVNLLGENRLASIGGGLFTVEERMLEAPPTANWPNFIMFQWGTARLAQLICKYLEMPGFEIAAYTAGLIHDLGKLLLIRLHPLAFQAIHNHASKYRVSFSVAEKVFLEADTLLLALHFAEKQGMPQRFCNVFRWLDNIREADEDAELIAIVSLARHFCRQNQVGFNGENPRSDSIPLKETTEWKILSGRVFLNFDLNKFETQIERECLQLKRELGAN